MENILRFGLFQEALPGNYIFVDLTWPSIRCSNTIHVYYFEGYYGLL